jgi:hypothetical protein
MADICTVMYKGHEYNVSSFLDKHPGGKKAIYEYNGKDITEAFDNVGHSLTAKKLLDKYIMDEKAKELAKEMANSAEYLNPTSMAWVYRKLFTTEDKNNIHKMFGFASLLSFMYRYLYVFPTTGNLGFSGTWFDYATIFLHFGLSASSLIFHVIEKRIIRNPLIIYEEYRLHAILFTARSVFVSLFGFHKDRYLSSEMQPWVLALVILFFHILVDIVTAKYGTKGITAVRVRDDGELRIVKLFFSYYQFIALASLLIVDKNLPDLGYNIFIAVQSSAFLMTLKRKQLVHWWSYIFWYGGSLLLSSYFIYFTKGYFFFVNVLFVFLLRTQYNMNKYIIWALYTLLAYNGMKLYSLFG